MTLKLFNMGFEIGNIMHVVIYTASILKGNFRLENQKVQ
jgi:hypothetical protein